MLSMKIRFLLILTIFNSAIFATNVKDMYIEVIYNKYHFYFTITNGVVEYRDSHHYLVYSPKSTDGFDILRYWQEDFIKLFYNSYDDVNIPDHRVINFKHNVDYGWIYIDSETKRGRLLLSLLSKIQRFPIEEENYLNSIGDD